jgi:two-component system response regulator MprA
VPSSSRLLVVEDDPELRHFLAGELAAQGYLVETAECGQKALQRGREEMVDLMLLDWTLPDLSGVEVCRRLRSAGIATAVVMVTARDAVQERVEALDAGADDYIIKPFSIEELLARVRARLRNTSAAPAIGSELLGFADLVVNTATREVKRGHRVVSLSRREYDLLLQLLQQPQRVKPRLELLHAVWGEPFVGDDNLLDVYIRYLRRKLEQPGETRLIQTVRGVGFRLAESSAS